MEQMSDAPRTPLMTSQGGVIFNIDHIEYWQQRARKAETALSTYEKAVSEVPAALTAARIEGERKGMERAIERLEKRAENSISRSTEYQIRMDIKAIRALAKELPHDPHC